MTVLGTSCLVSAVGVTEEVGEFTRGETSGSVPVGRPVFSVSTEDLPGGLLFRIPVSDSTVGHA